MKRVTVGEEEDEDLILDDGWVQRDEQKDQLKRRLKRTGYGRWRKSLDAAARYELERENITASIEVDDDYYSFEKRRRDQAASGRSLFSASSAPSLIPSRESSFGVLPSPSSAPSSSSSSSSSSSTPSVSLSSSKSTSSAGWVAGGRTSSSRVQQRRSIGVTRAQLERALECEAQAVASDEPTTQRSSGEKSELQHNDDDAKGKKSKSKSKNKEKGDAEKNKKNKKKKKKQESKLLFWKKGKSGEDEAADRPMENGGDEGEGSAVPERERTGTMDLYAAMGSGYHKQQLALGQQ